MDDRHLVDRDAEPVGHQLGEGRLVALAMRVRAGQNLDGAHRIDPDLGRFPQADAGTQRPDRLRGGDAARLDIGGESDAAQLAGPRALALALAEILVVGHVERLLERGRVVAGVIRHDHRGLVRELADEVLLAEGRRILPELPGRHLDKPLDDEGRLRPPRAAIGVDWRGGRVDAFDLAVDRRDVVLARQQRRVQIGRHRAGEGRQIGAEIGLSLHPHRQDLAFVVKGELRMGEMVTAVRVAQERLGAIGHPLHRPADLLRRPDADRLLGIDEDLRAETAADIRRDHPQLVLGCDADEGRQHQPGHMRVLAGGIERERLGAAVIVADCGARLHRVGDQPVVDDVELGHVLGAGKGRVSRRLVAQMPVIHDIVGGDVVHHRGALLRRRHHVDHRRQHRVVDHDRLGRVAGLRIGLGDHHRHMVADVADLALGQRRMATGAHRRAVLVVDHPAADQPADLVGHEIIAGENREHAGRRLGRGRVDAIEGGVGMRRAHEHRIGLAGLVDVVGVPALAGDEAEVFFAADWGADAGRGHGVFLLGRRLGRSLGFNG